MALELRDYLLTDAGVAVSGWTVNLRTGRKTGAAGAVLFSTTTDVNGMWEFVNGSGGVTLVGGTKYDVQATNGTSERWWRGYTAIPQEFTDLQVAAAAGIVLTKLDEGTADDTVDPTTAVTTLDGRISQFAALLKRLSGGSTFSAAPTRGPSNSAVNGDFTEWRRGTSFAGIASGAFFADRWNWFQSGSAVITMARDTSVPTVGSNAINTPYSAKMTIPATADAAIAAGDFYALYQGIEGFDYRALTNGLAISFWVKAHRTGTYCVTVRNRGPDRSFVTEYTVNAADTWEYKTVVVTTPPTAGTWDYTTNVGLYLIFTLAAGSSSQGTGGSWQSSGLLATANQVNGVGATTDVFQLALVNVVPGSVATPLVPLPAALQLARCRRYLIVLADSTHIVTGLGQAISTTSATFPFPLGDEMGGAPTITITSPTNFVVETAGGGVQACTALAAANTYPNIVVLTATTASGLVAGNATYLTLSTTGSIYAAWNPA